MTKDMSYSSVFPKWTEMDEKFGSLGKSRLAEFELSKRPDGSNQIETDQTLRYLICLSTSARQKPIIVRGGQEL